MLRYFRTWTVGVGNKASITRSLPIYTLCPVKVKVLIHFNSVVAQDLFWHSRGEDCVW